MKTLIIALLFIFNLSAFAQDIKVENSYVRLLPPTSPTTAAFMTITNNSNKLIKLIKAESDCCNLIELHTHLNENGMMRMRQVKNIEIPAKGKATLKPGGLHIMLIGLKNPLKKDDQVSLKLYFDNKETLEIKAKAKKVMSKMMPHH